MLKLIISICYCSQRYATPSRATSTQRSSERTTKCTPYRWQIQRVERLESRQATICYQRQACPRTQERRARIQARHDPRVRTRATRGEPSVQRADPLRISGISNGSRRYHKTYGVCARCHEISRMQNVEIPTRDGPKSGVARVAEAEDRAPHRF